MITLIKDIKNRGENLVKLLVQSVDVTKSTNGTNYQMVHVMDESGSTRLFMDFDNVLSFKKPCVYEMIVKVSQTGDSLRYKVLQAEAKENESLEAFYPKPHIDPMKAWEKINAYYKMITHPGLKRITQIVLLKSKEEFKTLPLTANGAFSRRCGIMEATVKLLDMASVAITTFHLDRDLTISAAIMYYMGNIDLVDETFTKTQNEILTTEAFASVKRLLFAESSIRSGTLSMKEEVLPEKAIRLLEHILLSKSRSVEGVTIEAITLSQLDYLIRKNDEIENCLQDADSGDIVVHREKRYLKVENGKYI